MTKLMLEAIGLEVMQGGQLLFRMEKPLQLYEGERLGIVGPNGAGKTTLLRLLAGQREPEAGTVRRMTESTVIDQIGECGQPAEASGGEQTRQRIQAALQTEAPLLFADEPTSHLDVEGIAFIEQTLLQYPGTVVLISHDRQLLDAVCTRTLAIEEGVVTFYPGGYSAYREWKAQEEKSRWESYEKYDRERERLKRSVQETMSRSVGMTRAPKRMGAKEARLGAEKGRQKQAKTHQAAKAVERRMEMLTPVEKPREAPEIRFDLNGYQPLRSKLALRFEDVAISRNGRSLSEPFSLQLKPGEKLALVGPNGSGKTTLLQAIAAGAPGITAAASGRIGTFHQDLSLLDESRSVLDNILRDSPYPETFVRTILARLLFRREDVLKPVSQISGGEKVKANLAHVFLSGCSILLLDEPTNYLDIEAREQLEHVLKAYPGTIVFTSHDRHFVDQLASRLLLLENGKVRLSEPSSEGESRSTVAIPGTTERKNGAAGPRPSVQRDAAHSSELLLLEMELSEVLSRLSAPRRGDQAAEWESRYQALLAKRKQLLEG